MVPDFILHYLECHQVPYSCHPHPRAVSAQQLAASLHISGYRVVKAVLVEAQGRRYIAALPAAAMLDPLRFADAVGATEAHLMREGDIEPLFPGCEVGAEPPFGALFGLPVVADRSLESDPRILCRAGSHEETLALRFDDFRRLEHPLVADIGVPFVARAESASAELWE
jgi:Ala-tRNA(Pro) deacylase